MRIYFRKELYNFSLKPFYWLNRWTFDSSVGISPVSQFNCSRSTAFSKAGNLSKDGLKTIWITHRKGLRLGAWEKCIGCRLTWGFRHKQPSLLKSGRRWWRGSVFLGIQPFLLLLKCLAHRPFHLSLSVRFSLFFFVYLFMSSLAYVFVYKYIYIYIQICEFACITSARILRKHFGLWYFVHPFIPYAPLQGIHCVYFAVFFIFYFLRASFD